MVIANTISIMLLTYKDIESAVSLFADSDINESDHPNKIVYSINCSRRNKNSWFMTVDAHKADGSGMPFSNTQKISNLNLVSRINRIAKLDDKGFNIIIRYGTMNENDEIDSVGEEKLIHVDGDRAT